MEVPLSFSSTHPAFSKYSIKYYPHPKQRISLYELIRFIQDTEHPHASCESIIKRLTKIEGKFSVLGLYTKNPDVGMAYYIELPEYKKLLSYLDRKRVIQFIESGVEKEFLHLVSGIPIDKIQPTELFDKQDPKINAEWLADLIYKYRKDINSIFKITTSEENPEESYVSFLIWTLGNFLKSDNEYNHTKKIAISFRKDLRIIFQNRIYRGDDIDPASPPHRVFIIYKNVLEETLNPHFKQKYNTSFDELIEKNPLPLLPPISHMINS
jgi:hypothetical protein